MIKPRKKTALGRGLGALLQDSPTKEVLAQSNNIALSRIRPNPYQPRVNFDSIEMEQLIISVRTSGVLMPILVRPSGDMFEIIAGERRWRAANKAGLKEIPAVVRNVTDLQALEFAIIENEQRHNLTAMESGNAYQRLVKEFHLTQQDIAEHLGISRTHVTNTIRLLQLPRAICDMIQDNKITSGHARPLIGLPDELAIELANTCITQAWNVREMEKQVKKHAHKKNNKQVQRTNNKADNDILALQDSISRHLGLGVKLKCNNKGVGELRISYKTLAELDLVLARLRTQI
ncbi:MAG: ParB/RepB/Spo0J family partition protein [Mariprofundales bacterium]